MQLRKPRPHELVEDLRRLARSGSVDVWPNIDVSEMTEAESADFIESAAAFLEEIATSGGPFASRARELLGKP